MKLIGVIPIARGISREKLTYFSSEDLPIGSIVNISLRSKTSPAIVVSSQDVAEEKETIKNLPYSIKKIGKKKATELFLPSFAEACQDTARYLAATTGSVLHAVVPKSILENLEKVNTCDLPSKTRGEVCEKFVIQADDEERYTDYKSIVREEFAKGYSVFICQPTIQEIKKALDILPKGIEPYTFILHGGLTKKEVITTWNKILAEKHTVLILGTGSFLSIPRPDIGTIIVDRENSRAYKNQYRPFLDTRLFAEKLSEKNKNRIIFGDILLRTETIWRFKNSELFELYPLKFRSLTTSEQKILDMRSRPGEIIIESTGKRKQEEIKFRVLSNSLLELIRDNQDNSENLFIFAARRGLSPSTLCADCNTIVTCNSCHAPTVLHLSPKGNFFLCHRCGERRSAMEKCSKCDSWRLTTLGIGTELVEQEINKYFPEVKVFRLDQDTANTHKKACELAEKFYSSPGSILIGTEMALPYISERLQNSAVVSIDSFFALPDFRINERILSTILKIRSFTTKTFILQTRNPDQKVLDYAIKGNLSDFYRDEIADRKQLEYPPFSTLIKISLTGQRDYVVEEMEKLQKIIEPLVIDVFPAFIPGPTGKYIMHGLIKIKRGEWINENLLAKLQGLPPAFSIDVDPESLL
jgi:primosomal protein N'